MSAIKKAVKKIGKFVRKHWKKIVLAAAVVFTAGIATVGMAGFSGAAAAAGGGIGGFLSAAGSTMMAGVASIGGTLGIGSGVTAGTAGGAFAGSAAVANATAAGLSGATLGSGAAAGALGIGPSAGAGAAAAATQAAAPVIAGMPAAPVASLGSTYGTGNGLAAAGFPSASMASQAGVPLAASAAPAAASGAAPAVASAAAPATGVKGFLMSPTGAALITGGIQGISAYMAAKQQEQQDPQALWGVGVSDDKSLNPSEVALDAPTAWSNESWRRNSTPTKVN